MQDALATAGRDAGAAKELHKHDAVAFTDTWNCSTVGSGMDRSESRRHHGRRPLHEPDSPYTLGHSLFECLYGNSRETQEVCSAIGAENELMWSHKAAPCRCK